MKLNEYFLYHIWDAQHLESSLSSLDGERIEVKYQGEWNTDSGPDFKNAILKIGDQILQGDVEIHLKTYDWVNHKHYEDVNFNSVILHVVYEHNMKLNYTVAENGTRITVIELKSQLNNDIRKLIKNFMASGCLIRNPDNCSFFGAEDPLMLEVILKQTGIIRFNKKLQRFNARLLDRDFDQLLYEGLLESLGYSKNKYQMYRLAVDIPFRNIRKWKKEGMTHEQLLAIWICSSGLYNYTSGIKDISILHKIKETYDDQDFYKNNLDYKWNCFRVRPQNNPVLRLIQISSFVYYSTDESLIHRVLNTMSFQKNKFNEKILLQRLSTLFFSDILVHRQQMGRKKLFSILINIIIPICCLYSEKMSFWDLGSILENLYKNLRGYEENTIISNMKKYMSEKQIEKIQEKFIFQQGLIHLYYSYCRSHVCELCNDFKKQLLSTL